jgi:hypothetical protein
VTYPPQGASLGARVLVLFNYDRTKPHVGICVRDDMAAPWLTIFALADGRYVLSTECQWRLARN